MCGYFTKTYHTLPAFTYTWTFLFIRFVCNGNFNEGCLTIFRLSASLIIYMFSLGNTLCVHCMLYIGNQVVFSVCLLQNRAHNIYFSLVAFFVILDFSFPTAKFMKFLLSISLLFIFIRKKVTEVGSRYITYYKCMYVLGNIHKLLFCSVPIL